jgi:iron(III) transport system substrate-binding protein
VSGECAIAVSNTYYFARALRTEVDGVSADIVRIGWVFPELDGNGGLLYMSGAGVAKYAPNRAHAVKFMEYLVSEQAQSYFSDGNDEYPVVAGLKGNAVVQKLGEFKADDVDLSAVAIKLPAALEIFNQVGWE